MKTNQKLSEIWRQFVQCEWDAIWCCGGTAWFAGTWTGPQRDLICLKVCDTNKEANEWLSPEGITPEEAIKKAVEKRAQLLQGKQVCARCGKVGSWDTQKCWGWCDKCQLGFGAISPEIRKEVEEIGQEMDEAARGSQYTE